MTTAGTAITVEGHSCGAMATNILATTLALISLHLTA
jgi:hypothetical protein